MVNYLIKLFLSWMLESLGRSSAKKTCNQIGLDMINDAFGYHQYNDGMVDDKETGRESSHNMNDDLGDFFQLMQEGQESLYEGCDKYSKLSFIALYFLSF